MKREVNTIFLLSDIDECEMKLHDCHPKAKCHNNVGGFLCLCKEGYKGNGVTCSREDQCFQSGKAVSNCSQLCFNTEQGYECKLERHSHNFSRYVFHFIAVFDCLSSVLAFLRNNFSWSVSQRHSNYDPKTHFE